MTRCDGVRFGLGFRRQVTLVRLATWQVEAQATNSTLLVDSILVGDQHVEENTETQVADLTGCRMPELSRHPGCQQHLIDVLHTASPRTSRFQVDPTSTSAD